MKVNMKTNSRCQALYLMQFGRYVGKVISCQKNKIRVVKFFQSNIHIPYGASSKESSNNSADSIHPSRTPVPLSMVMLYTHSSSTHLLNCAPIRSINPDGISLYHSVCSIACWWIKSNALAKSPLQSHSAGGLARNTEKGDLLDI